MLRNCIVALAAILLLAAGAHSNQSPQSGPIYLDSSQEKIIVDQAAIVADPTETMTFDQALHASYENTELDRKIGPYSHVYWIKLTVHGSGETPNTHWMLCFDTGWRYVDAYIPEGTGFAHLHSGNNVPPSRRPINTSTIAIPLPPAGEGDLTIFVRIQGNTRRAGLARNVRMSIEQEDAFIGDTRIFNYLQGIYAGIVLAMVAYNLILFLGLRELTYLFYALAAITFGLVWINFSRFPYDYLWPDAERWNMYSSFCLSALAVVFGALFVRSFFNTWKLWKAADAGLRGIAVAAVALCIAGFLWPTELVAPFLGILALLTCIFCIVLGIVMLARGYRPARFFLLAWTAHLAGNGVYILSYLSVLPLSPLNIYVVEIGSALDCIFLTFALADRLKTMKQESEDRQKHYALQLEEEVEERTTELQEVNARLEAVSITDPLTGLKNRRFVESMVDSLTSDIKRRLYIGEAYESLAICIADIDHFKQVNDRYGHQLGDKALKLIASGISASVRGTTIVARWGGEEFLLVDRAPLRDDGTAFAERMRRVAEDLPVRTPEKGEVWLTMSLGMSHYPFSKGYPDLFNWEDVLMFADQALYHAKECGRNRWFVFRCNEEKLRAYIQQFGQEAASTLCRFHSANALNAGLIELVSNLPASDVAKPKHPASVLYVSPENESESSSRS